MKKLIFGLLSALMALTLTSAPVLAYTDPICSDSSISSETKESAGCNTTKTIWPIIQTLLNAAIALAGFICVVFIIISAIKLMTSAGDASKAASGRKGLLFAVVGMVVCILSWAIINFILASIF